MSVSYWLDPLKPEYAPLSVDSQTEVVVIGGGLCGASAAYHLAEQGIQTTLLEARTVAESASGRNAGFLLQGTAERYSRAIALLGRDKARRIHAWSIENHQRIAAQIKQDKIVCEYQKRGSLQLAGSPEEEAELLQSADLLNDDGFKAVFLEKEKLAPALQRAGFQMGVHLPEDGELHPSAFVRGVIRSAQQKGAIIHENSRVIEVDASTPGDVRIHTQNGTVRADLLILATNARAGELFPILHDKIDPVRGQMLATGPQSELFTCPIYANHGYDYWRQDKSGRIILGGWRNLDPEGEVGHEEKVINHIQKSMKQFLDRMGVGAPVVHQWAGIMGFSRDGMPLVGPIPGSAGALSGVGFTGHGFGFAFLAGQALATQVIEGQHPFCMDFDPRRFL